MKPLHTVHQLFQKQIGATKMQHAAHLSPRQNKEKSSADGGFETLSPASPLYCANAAIASALFFIKHIKRSVLSPMRIDFVFLPLS